MSRLALGFLAASLTLAQPRFDVASVKPGSPDATTVSMIGGPLPDGPFNTGFMHGTRDPSRITWTDIWLKRVIQIAYDLPVDRIEGPDWLETQKYVIAATLPAGTSVADFRLMLQGLLTERFKLTVHRGTKDVSGYVLELGKNPPKLKPSSGQAEIKVDPNGRSNSLMVTDQTGFPAPRPGNAVYQPGAYFEGAIPVNGTDRVTILNGTMQRIAAYLGRFAGGPAEDRTELSGKYDVHLEFVPSPATPEQAAAAELGPDIFAAVESQLGLKLVPGKVPVETLAVDHAERVPAAD